MKVSQPPQLSDSLRFLGPVLRPILRFCLRRSIKLQELIEAAKQIFVEVATEEIKATGGQPTASKLSMMTGVHRKDVARFLGGEPRKRQPMNPIVRVIGQWLSDKHYRDGSGKPAPLTFEGRDSQFVKLISHVSQDLNPYAVLFELERLGMVRREEERLVLVTDYFNPGQDAEHGFQLLGADAEDILCAVEENLFSTPEIPNLHIKTEYDNVAPGDEAKIRRWFIDEGAAFHRRARDFLSQYDRDINRSLPERGSRLRVAVGTFSRVEKEGEDK